MSLPPLARADDHSALAVAVESADARVRAPAIRRALGQALGVPIVSLLDAGVEGTGGTLAVVVARGGRSAQLFFQARTGRRQLVRVAAPDGERGVSWIAIAAVALIRRDLASRRWTVPSEVLDPFDGEGGTPTPSTSEVLDPWARDTPRRSRSESGAALGRPEPR